MGGYKLRSAFGLGALMAAAVDLVRRSPAPAAQASVEPDPAPRKVHKPRYRRRGVNKHDRPDWGRKLNGVI